MPFPKQEGKPFTRANIEAITPDQFGVYGLYKGATWIYIGKGDIRERLLAHYNGDNACITRENPTHFCTWVTANADAEEKKLTTEFDLPICNKKVG